MGPLEWAGLFVVGADVAHDFSLEVNLRGEDPAGDEVTLNLGEPNLDLIEPRRVGWRKMDTDVGMVSEEGLDPFGFVCREIVGDDVDFFSGRLRSHDIGEECNELCAGMSACSLAHDLSGACIQRGVK